MKKIIAAVLFVMLCQVGGNFCTAWANDSDTTTVLSAKIECTWVNMHQTERDAKIKYIKGKLFSDGNAVSIKKKDFRNQYRGYLKDKKYKTNYRLISNNVEETKDYNMAGFFKDYGDAKILYSYALQPKNDLKHIYYYSAYGTLAYIDDIQGDYPNFPYISKQYKNNGKLAGVIYYENHDVQYVYEPDGDFKGLWYKDKMYNRKGKEILTRSNW